MDLNTTIDIIIKDLNEASQIIDDLKLIPGVPALQVELAKSKCKTASDVIALLKSLPEAGVGVKPVSAPIEVPKSERKAEIPEIKQPVKSAEEPVTSEKTRKTTAERATLSKAPPVVKEEAKTCREKNR